MDLNLSWMKKAIEEGRVCPECRQPVTKGQWRAMNLGSEIISCWNCRYAHWQFPLRGAGGSSRLDNGDREDLNRIRGRG